VEESLEVASACQWGFFGIDEPEPTHEVERLDPVGESLQFSAAVLLVDFETVVGVEGEPAVIDTGDIEASYSKIYSPRDHLEGTLDYFDVRCLAHHRECRPQVP
jgi:hypothetical protein